MFGAGASRADIGNHGGLAATREAVFEHLGQLALAVGHVLFLKRERPDALLQGQQRGIYFLPFIPRFLVVVSRVRASLAACQVDETHFRVQAVICPQIQLHLKNCVRARARIVCTSLATTPDFEALTNGVHDGLDAVDCDLAQIFDVDFLVVVFETLDFFFVVEQVLQLLAVYFVERHRQV